MSGARGLGIVSLAAFIFIALTGFTFTALSSRGQRVIDSHLIVAADDFHRVRQGEVPLTQEGVAKRLEGSLQVVEGASEMIHAGGHMFLACGLLAATGGVFQVMLLRRLRTGAKGDAAT